MNTASVTAVDQADTNAANDSDTVDITVQSIDIAVVKTVDDATPSEGGTINYTVIASNGGPAALAKPFTSVLMKAVAKSIAW